MFLADLPLYKKLTRKRSVKFAQYLNQLIDENSYMLDFGCGNMYTSQELLKLNPSLRIMGLDVIKDQNLHDSILKDNRLAFTLLTTRELPFPDNTFDVTVALAVMHHTDNPEYYLSELKRVTKPTGHVILVEEMYINPIDRIWISSQDWILNKMKEGVPVPLNFRSHKHYLQEFKRQNLNVVFAGGLRAFLTQMHAYVYKLQKAG
ncbi:MAG TPA: class I SAM-dependent methyltransferase [Flavipsychrobacter sp.]|nr:class I SAM-dependent methyltransferase [Flavipsychrobacter sp.]